MKITQVITVLLMVSICVNVFFLSFYVPSDQNRISGLISQINNLTANNTQLQSKVDQTTPGISSTGGIVGYASLQAPAVSQTVQMVNRGRYIAQTLVQKGSIMNISVEIAPGKGRVLVQTKPLMGVVFQDAANTAVAVARNKTGVDLSNSDVIFSIDSGDKISEVDGPSAGALMTLLTISAIDRHPIDQRLTLTGTIDGNGHIGAIGGVIAKATAAKENGKTLFMIPGENQLITPPVPLTAGTGIFSVARQPQQQVSASDYIEKNIGINITYVNTIDDVIAAALKPSK
ncbi:MAG: S16 family serine protease [Methanoregula sp.]|jgi:predicted S18 family serine protease